MVLSETVAAQRDPREAFRAASAEPGGNQVPVVLTDTQRAVLNAVADELIPPGGGFPRPSEVGVVDDFFVRYITPASAPANRFPFAREDEFKAAADRMAEPFLRAGHDGRVAQLEALEKEQPDFFGQLRALTYAGYYSRPAVLLALRQVLPAGRDYHGPPLPYGYDLTTPDWDEITPPGAGSYTETSDVVRIDVKGMS
jgi:hypothetical protein